MVFRGHAATHRGGVPMEEARRRLPSGWRAGRSGCVERSRTQIRRGQGLREAIDAARARCRRWAGCCARATGPAARHRAGEVATHLELEADLESRLRHALAYRRFLAVAASVGVDLGTVVVPKFAALIPTWGRRCLRPPAAPCSRHEASSTGQWLTLLARSP